MAAQILGRLERLNRLPDRYLILELSPELRQRQQQTLTEQVPGLAHRVTWLERLPERFSGVMLANEVLDAMPVDRFRKTEAGVEEQWVRQGEAGLESCWRPAGEPLAKAVESIEQEVGALAPGYLSEVNPGIEPWLKAVAASLDRGVALLIDYGHPRPAYYHPQRHMGTLRCHLRHRAHDDPLLLPGLQDITAHVDFTAVAEGAQAAGLERLGYASQARFLIGCGLDRLLAESDPSRVADHMVLVQGAKQLVSPGGMGEQFKVMALGKAVEDSLIGFSIL
jgi:SAM-dependent MidA family methyltransferase